MGLYRFLQMIQNGGTFEGRRYLSENSAKSFITNFLPDGLMPYYWPDGYKFWGEGYTLGGASIMFVDKGSASPKDEIYWFGRLVTVRMLVIPW